MSNIRLTLEEAAAFLKKPASELRSLAVQNEIKYTQQGERYYFSQDDLVEWVTKEIISLGTKKSTAKRKVLKTLKLPDTSESVLAKLCNIEVSCDVRAKSRPSVLRALSELAAESGLVYDPNDLYNELIEREEIASTAIEQGAAIPHPHHRFKTPIFEESFICVAKLVEPIY